MPNPLKPSSALENSLATLAQSMGEIAFLQCTTLMCMACLGDITMPGGKKMERDFKIVGSNEADPRNGKISDESAVGKALLGAKVGKTVQVETPAGIAKYKIVTISR